MWDKKGENLTYRFLRLLKEQTTQEQQPNAEAVVQATKNKAPRCLRFNIIAFGAGISRFSNMADKVKQVQSALGFTGSNLDGKFGQNTLEAVLKFQIENNLEPDGCVGPKTLAALKIPEDQVEKQPQAAVEPTKPSSKAEWAKTTYEAAKKALGSKYGISMPLLVVTFGALESAFGKRAIGNNLFGIKASTIDGKCPGKVVGTKEVVRGKKYTRQSCFADYPDPEKAIEGFAKFLQGKRYRDAFDLFPDSPTFALAWIWANGYATGERYVPVMVSVANRIAKMTGIKEFEYEYPEELKKAMKLLINSRAMEEYALNSAEMPASSRRYFNKVIEKSKNKELSQKKRHNLIMQAAAGGRRYLGKKLIARAYALSRGKDELEAQKFAEVAARTGFRPIKKPMPSEEQLKQLASATTSLERKYA